MAWLGDASRLSPSFCLCLSGHRKIWSLELLTGRTTSSKLVDTIHRIQPQAERKKVREVTAACTRPHCWVSQEQRLQKQAEEAELSLKFNIDMPAHALHCESLFSRKIAHAYGECFNIRAHGLKINLHNTVGHIATLL